MITALPARYPNSSFLNKASSIYRFRASIEKLRGEIPAQLPDGESVIGFSGYMYPIQTFVWLPFGHHRVREVLREDSPKQLAGLGLHYLVVDETFLNYEAESLAQLTADLHGKVIHSWEIDGGWGKKPVQIYLLHLRPPTGPN